MTRMLSRLVRLAVISTAIVATVTSGSGCMTVAGWFSGATNAVATRAKEHQDLAEVRRETRDELADQREDARKQAVEQEVQNARLAAERARLEQAICQANQELLQERVRGNLKEKVESKVVFNVQQGLEVGELEVDMEQLEALIEERKKQPPTSPLTNLPVKQPCACCDQPCGCEPGLLRRLCPKCRHKPCEAEKKCGGPEGYEQLVQAPVKQPLRPTQIPLKLPVRLVFGMQNPELEGARIRIEPPPPTAPVKGPCENHPCVDKACPNGVCPNGLAPSQAGSGSAAETPVSTRRWSLLEGLEVPQPSYDDEARRREHMEFYNARRPVYENAAPEDNLTFPVPALPASASGVRR